MPQRRWHQIDCPPVPVLLARLAEQGCAVFAGPEQPLTVFWPDAVHPLCQLDDLTPVPGSIDDDKAHGWPQVTGGSLLQLDYELPVGAWSANQSSARPRGWQWTIGPQLRLNGSAGHLWATDSEYATIAARITTRAPAATISTTATPVPLMAETAHAAAVTAVRDHIAAGAIYQANVTVPFTAELAPDCQAPGTALFTKLLAQAPGCHSVLWRQGGREIISHSPELFLNQRGRQVVSEPIKGTRRRVPGHEAAVRTELLQAGKDNAELAMIVDLVRNDLGRIATPGTVHVRDRLAVMDLPYVHHLYAAVTAELLPGHNLPDLLAAAFPAGSITGAPKIKAMEILQELEVAERGPYCGSIGWWGSDACCLSVAIRTMVVEQGTVRFDAGGGIVADSDPAAEWQEVLAKAGPMAAACGARL